MLSDEQVHIDRHSSANRHDIIIKNHSDKMCIITDIAVPSDYNVETKEAEEILIIVV